jgi:hypothetical protein
LVWSAGQANRRARQVPEVFLFLGALAVVAFGFDPVDFALLVALDPVGFELDPRVGALLLFEAGALREAAVFVEPDVEAAFAVEVDGAVDRRDDFFLPPIGRASPTAFTAPPATSPTVPAIFPAVLPTLLTTLPASGIGRPPCVRRITERSIAFDACAMPTAASGPCAQERYRSCITVEARYAAAGPR